MSPTRILARQQGTCTSRCIHARPMYSLFAPRRSIIGQCLLHLVPHHINNVQPISVGCRTAITSFFCTSAPSNTGSRRCLPISKTAFHAKALADRQGGSQSGSDSSAASRDSLLFTKDDLDGGFEAYASRSFDSEELAIAPGNGAAPTFNGTTPTAAASASAVPAEQASPSLELDSHFSSSAIVVESITATKVVTPDPPVADEGRVDVVDSRTPIEQPTHTISAVSQSEQPASNASSELSQAPPAASSQTTKTATASPESQFPPQSLQVFFNGRYWRALKVVLKVAATIVGTTALLVASHAFGLVGQWVAALLGAVGLAAYGYRSSSLSLSGAIAAAVVGTTLGCSMRLGATLIAFYISSSKLTHFKGELKEILEEEENKKGGQRDWKQVFCNGGPPTVFAILYGLLVGCVDVPLGVLNTLQVGRAKLVTTLMGAFLGYYACCCGDTWSSELGTLSSDPPILITTGKPVKRGTNGAVSPLGLWASIAGGLFVGLVFYLSALLSPTLWVFEGQWEAAFRQWILIPLGGFAGLSGSLLDSLLGATIQFSGFHKVTKRPTSKPGPDVEPVSGVAILDNNAVNVVSATTTSFVTAILACKLFGF